MKNSSFQSLLPISRKKAIAFCLLLTSFELLAYIASDMVMPFMLQVTSDLNASPRHVPTALNAYLFGGVAFQWLIGALSDRFGRKPLLQAGAIGFALFCLAASSVQHIQIFNLLRFIQGIVLGFIIVVSYPVLQEAFSEKDAVRLMALLGNIALLSPLVGPLLGSILLSVMSWRMLFNMIGIASLLIAIGLWFGMPETLGVRRRDGSTLPFSAFPAGQILNDYRSLLNNSVFINGSLVLGLLSVPLLAWIGLSPLLLMRYLGYSAIDYGLWQLPVLGSLMLGNLVLNYAIEKMELEQLLRLALIPIGSGLMLMPILTWYSGSLAVLSITMGIYTFGLGLGNACLYRLTLFSSDMSKGIVAAMLGMISTALLSLGCIALSMLNAGSSLVAFSAWTSLASTLAIWPLWKLFRQREAMSSRVLHPAK